MSQPDAVGCYRVRLTVWDALGHQDIDIRDLGVRCANGLIIPPFQGTPPPLPLVGLGAKPSETNFKNQPFGWAGNNDSDVKLLHQALLALDNLIGGGGITLAGDTNGPAGSNTTSALRGHGIDTSTPLVDDVLQFDGTNLTFNAPLTAFAVSSFASAVGTLFEIGQSVTNPTFTASYNRSATAAVVNDGSGNTVWSTPYTSGASTGIYVKSTNAQTQTFTLNATRGHGTASASVVFTWGTRLYYGAADTPGLYNSAFITGLSDFVIKTSRAATMTIVLGATNHGFIALPASFGTPTFTVGGFVGGFSLVASAINVMNAYGVTVSYNIWATNQTGPGTIIVTVS
jgi:hypothetical protein